MLPHTHTYTHTYESKMNILHDQWYHCLFCSSSQVPTTSAGTHQWSSLHNTYHGKLHTTCQIPHRSPTLMTQFVAALQQFPHSQKNIPTTHTHILYHHMSCTVIQLESYETTKGVLALYTTINIVVSKATRLSIWHLVLQPYKCHIKQLVWLWSGTKTLVANVGIMG